MVKPYIPTVVIDDFFETPELWRYFALNQEFFKGNRGTWPGLRTKMLYDLCPALYNTLEFKLLQHVPFNSFSKIETTFQIIDETYGKGWVHDDNPEHDVAGVIYLNEHTVPNSGTTLYSDKFDISGDHYTELFVKDVSTDTPEEREQFNKYREEQRSFFTQTASVDSRWNRCIIFDPRTWHSADNFFGTTKEDARLTLVFFGNAA